MLPLIFWFFNCNFYYFIFFFPCIDYLSNFLYFTTFESTLTIISQLLISLSLNLKLFLAVLLYYISYCLNTLNTLPFLLIYIELNNYWNFFNFTPRIRILVPLYNGLMIIHPVLLYFAVALFIFLFLLNFFVLLIKAQLRLNYNQLVLNFFIIILAVFLGCAWANQELNWGGWWSWDIIELGSLIILLFLIKMVHVTWINEVFFYNNNTRYLVYFLFFWFGARFGFFNSIHSFIDQQNFVILTKKLYFIFVYALFYYYSLSVKSATFNKFIKCIDVFIKFIFFSILTDSFTNIFSNFILFITTLLKLVSIIFFKIKFIPANFTNLDLFYFLFFINKNSFKKYRFLHTFIFLLIFSFFFTNFYFNVKNTYEIIFDNNYFVTAAQYLKKNVVLLYLLCTNNNSMQSLNNSQFFISTGESAFIFKKLLTQVFELEILFLYFFAATNLYFIIKINLDFIIIIWSFAFFCINLLKLVKLAFK